MIVTQYRRIISAAALRIRERLVVVGQWAAAIRRIWHAALCQRFEIVVERIRWKGSRFARIVFSVKVLTTRGGQGTGHVEIRRVILLREHFRHAQSLPLSDASVYLTEFAS